MDWRHRAACLTEDPELFFPIGKHAGWHPEILKQVAAAGHSIGSHTWSHKDLSNKKLTEEDAKAEIEKGISAVSVALGGKPIVFNGTTEGGLDVASDQSRLTDYIAPVPVPEPETWALMGIGALLVGARAARHAAAAGARSAGSGS